MLTKKVDGREVVLTAEEEAEIRAEWAANAAARDAEKAAAAARKAARDAALRDTPANVNSVPALRAEVDKIKAILRGEVPE